MDTVGREYYALEIHWMVYVPLPADPVTVAVVVTEI